MCSAEIVDFPNCCSTVHPDQAAPTERLQAERRSIALRPSADERGMIRMHFLGPDGQPHQTTLSSTFRRREGTDAQTSALQDADADAFVQGLFENYYKPFGCTFLYASYLYNRTLDLT